MKEESKCIRHGNGVQNNEEDFLTMSFQLRTLFQAFLIFGVALIAKVAILEGDILCSFELIMLNATCWRFHRFEEKNISQFSYVNTYDLRKISFPQ